MTKLGVLYPSKYVKHADLLGKPVDVIIEAVTTEVFENGEKPVVTFRGRKKALVLNKTNAYAIGEEHGDDTDRWIGKRITLYPARVEYRGKFVDSIRVRVGATAAPIAPPSAEPLQQVPPADIGDYDDEVPPLDDELPPGF